MLMVNYIYAKFPKHLLGDWKICAEFDLQGWLSLTVA